MQQTRQEFLQEFIDAGDTRLQIDRAQSVIRGVKILGLRSRNGRVYLPTALAAAAQLYEGAKVNVNHPKGHPHGPRDYQDRIGTLRSVANGNGPAMSWWRGRNKKPQPPSRPPSTPPCCCWDWCAPGGGSSDGCTTTKP